MISPTGEGRVRAQRLTTVEAFNNQSSTAQLLHAYDSSAAKRFSELQDLVDDLMIGF
jgi:hypothetical protein